MKGILTRDFIRGCLYEGSRSYFYKGDIIAKINPLNFKSFLGRKEYETAVRAHYDAGGRGWLTPSEIFQPFYGQALANKLVSRLAEYSSRSSQSSHPLVIYEVGGGSGVAASDVLDWLRRVKPSIYATCEYTILEISKGLNKRQQETFSRRGHSQRAKSLLVDATNLQNARSIVPKDDRFCIVIGLEVLDNLPHDKVVVFTPTDESKGHEQLLETRVIDLTETNTTGRQVMSESYEPISDPLIQTMNNLWELEQQTQTNTSKTPIKEIIASSVRKRGMIRSILFGIHTALLATGKFAINLFGVLPPGSRAASEAKLASLRPPLPRNFKSARFLPTGCLSLLMSLEDTFPKHELLLSDFDSLPPASLQLSSESVERDTKVTCYAPAGKCEPLVSSKNANASQDHVTYLSAPKGAADIFFETDFNLLARMIKHVRRDSNVRPKRLSETHVSIVSSSDFLKANVDVQEVGTTRSGWNPLLQDFTNVNVLST
jgi:hypothetical protein